MKNMFRNFGTIILHLTIACSFLACEQGAKKPQNIIILIADGCGFNQIEAASLYQYGESGKQIYENFPVRLAMSTYPLEGTGYNPDSAWASFKYVLRKPTDSAASATAMSTGFKTFNKAIGVDSAGTPLWTAVEYFEANGKSTAVVTSVPWTHATPAAFAAHDLSRGSLSEIAYEMLFKSRLDVIMGTTHPYYDESGNQLEEPDFREIGGQGIWDSLISGKAGNDADGDGKIDYWHFIQDRQEFQKLQRGETPKRVIGIPKVKSTLQLARNTSAETGEPYSVPFIDTVPTLSEMALAALNIIDENQNGFFLMVEGGAVDWAAHKNHMGRMIEEEIEFNKTIETICDWIEKNSSWDKTLIIITGDHETGYLTGPGSDPERAIPNHNLTRSEIWKPLLNNGKGKLPGGEWHTRGHTNSLIPFFSKGAGSDAFLKYADRTDPVRGKYLDNTAIGKVLHSF